MTEDEPRQPSLSLQSPFIVLSLLRGSVSRYIRLNSRVSNLASYSFKETTVEIIESHFLERRNQSKRRKMKLSFVVYQIFTNFDTLRDVLVPVRVKNREKTLWCNFSESQREQRSRRIENKSFLIFYQAFCLFRSFRLFLYRELEWWNCDEEMAGNFVLFIKVSFLWITFSQIKIMESWKKWKFFANSSPTLIFVEIFPRDLSTRVKIIVTRSDRNFLAHWKIKVLESVVFICYDYYKIYFPAIFHFFIFPRTFPAGFWNFLQRDNFQGKR